MCFSLVVFIWSQKAFSGYGPLGARKERRSFGVQKGRKRRGGKLFHREERPARERHIIDTSEWTCANYRYVIGWHFWVLPYTSEPGELANIFVKYFVFEL